MTASIATQCARESCPRKTYREGLPFCSAVCAFAQANLDESLRAATDDPDIFYTVNWYEASVRLSNLVTEITEFKRLHYQANKTRGNNGYGKAGFQAVGVSENRAYDRADSAVGSGANQV